MATALPCTFENNRLSPAPMKMNSFIPKYFLLWEKADDSKQWLSLPGKGILLWEQPLWNKTMNYTEGEHQILILNKRIIPQLKGKIWPPTLSFPSLPDLLQLPTVQVLNRSTCMINLWHKKRSQSRTTNLIITIFSAVYWCANFHVIISILTGKLISTLRFRENTS